MLLWQMCKFYHEVHTINIRGTPWYDLHVNRSALKILKQCQIALAFSKNICVNGLNVFYFYFLTSIRVIFKILKH